MDVAVEYYRDTIEKYSEELRTKMMYWNKYKSDISIPDVARAKIRRTLRRARRLIKMKFNEFRDQLDDYDHGGIKVSSVDVEEFWDMLKQRMEALRGTFSDLENDEMSNFDLLVDYSNIVDRIKYQNANLQPSASQSDEEDDEESDEDDDEESDEPEEMCPSLFILSLAKYNMERKDFKNGSLFSIQGCSSSLNDNLNTSIDLNSEEAKKNEEEKSGKEHEESIQTVDVNEPRQEPKTTDEEKSEAKKNGEENVQAIGVRKTQRKRKITDEHKANASTRKSSSDTDVFPGQRMTRSRTKALLLAGK